MRFAVSAMALGALLLGGCAGSAQGDFVAEAPNPAPQEMTPSARAALDARIAYHAKRHHLPESLVHAAIQRESKYNPSLRNGPFWGLMQIRYDTARSVGYAGPARGLLEAETNLTYGVTYLANAYLVAGGDERRALRLYASGFYYDAKRQGLLGQLQTADASLDRPSDASDPAPGK